MGRYGWYRIRAEIRFQVCLNWDGRT